MRAAPTILAVLVITGCANSFETTGDAGPPLDAFTQDVVTHDVGRDDVAQDAVVQNPRAQSTCCAPCDEDELCLLQGSFGGLGSGVCTSVGDERSCFSNAGCGEGFDCRGAQINGFYEPSCSGTAVGDIAGECHRTE